MPFFLAAVENVKARPSAQALTGPIARGDVETVKKHFAALAAMPELRAFSVALSRRAIPLAARAAGADPARLSRDRGRAEGLGPRSASRTRYGDAAAPGRYNEAMRWARKT